MALTTAESAPILADYLDRWLDDLVRPCLEPATHSFYQTMTRVYLVPALGHRRLDEIKADDIQAWIDTLAASCQCCARGKDAARPEGKRRCCAAGRCCRDVAGTRTIRAAHTTLRTALNDAMKFGHLISANPARFTELPKPAKVTAPAATWTTDDAVRFLMATRSDARHAAYVLILLTGLSKGQVLGLTWPGTDLGNRAAEARWLLQRVGGKLIHKPLPRPAAVPLPDLAVAALRHRRAGQDAARERAGDRWQPSDLVFTTGTGAPVEPASFHQSFRTWCTRAGVPPVQIRAAGHARAAILAELDADPGLAARLLPRPRPAAGERS